ncbi:hypothetical protein [Pseudomonas aeruginosa]|uniref:hypothetical protein n=1 Tax=Pseudomonas aeruginosa TaxID=287 RepID=UPI000B5A2AB4|nr:hypothetical protein [Pseudomonas aeruginosa]ASJ88620.1 hypothetical protein PSA83_06494 [Pseudomonas aeruginosa]
MKTHSTLATASLLGLLASAIPAAVFAASLEEQAKNLEASVKTVEQRREDGLRDLKENAIKAYRDAIKIDSVETDIAEVFDRTARVRVVVTYSFAFEEAKGVRSTIDKYFVTNTDKETGVEPYGMIYTRYQDCVAENCSISKEARRYLESTAVGINVSFLGEWQAGILASGSGRFDLKPGKMTYLIDVPKSKIKGDPKPVVKGQIYNVHYCTGEGPCSGVTYSQR